MTAWPWIENIAIVILAGVLCVHWDSAWPLLILLMCNGVRITRS